MGDKYIALKDCYFARRLVKAGETVVVAPGTKTEYPWLKKIYTAPVEKPKKSPAKKSVKKTEKAQKEDEKEAAIRENLEK